MLKRKELRKKWVYMFSKEYFLLNIIKIGNMIAIETSILLKNPNDNGLLHKTIHDQCMLNYFVEIVKEMEN